MDNFFTDNNNINDLQKEIIESFLILVSKGEAVHEQTLFKACVHVNKPHAFCMFSNGIREVLTILFTAMNDEMIVELSLIVSNDMRIRDKINTAIKIRLLLYTKVNNFRLFLAGLSKFICQRGNLCFAYASTYELANHIWWYIGDKSLDYNFYTKRMLLAKVYSITLLYFMRDHSQDFRNTWRFLDQQINNIIKIQQLKKQKIFSMIKKYF